MRVVITETNSLNNKDLLILTPEIFEEDIAEGEKESDCACPIALAMKRELYKNNVNFEYTRVSVADTRIRVYCGTKLYLTDTPQEMREFIFRYDANLEVQSFSSTLIFERIAN